MSIPEDIYDNLCAKLNLPTDSKIRRSLAEVSASGELNIAGQSVTSQTCEVLSKVLTQSKDIVKFDASDCLLPPQGLAALLAIMHLTKVNTLQLRGNNIGGPSVYKLSKMISRCSNLKNLGLEWNNLGLCSEGMSLFCNSLAENHSLEVLDLRNNQLDEESAMLLAGALRKNTTLRALDVRWNSMEQSGGQHFLSVFHTNKTLTALKLQGNSISNEILVAIEQAVQHNKSLLRLESGYEARSQLLANQVRVIQDRRAQDLREWSEKSQRQISEMELKIKEFQTSLISKQQQVDDLEKIISEKTKELGKTQNQVKEVQNELKLQEQNHLAVVRDYQLQLATLNKALAANKIDLSTLEEKLEEEKKHRGLVEKERTRDKERIRQLEQEIEKRKDELQNMITEHVGTVEQERKQFQQRLALVEEEWNGRLQQTSAEHARAEQVYRDRVRALESALSTAEQTQIDLNTQWAAERAKWAEEKANIWAEAKEKESCKVLLLSEKVEHLKEEKTSLEAQLSVANSSVQQLQRDNSNVMADLADLRRKLSAVQEELSSEKLLTQKLRSEKAEETRVLEAVKGELTNAQKSVSEAYLRQDKLQREVQSLTERLDEKQRLISNIRKEEKERVQNLITTIKNYADKLNVLDT